MFDAVSLPTVAAALVLAAGAGPAADGAAGSSELGTLLAVLATLAAILVGVVWFPLKRVVEAISVAEGDEEPSPESSDRRAG